MSKCKSCGAEILWLKPVARKPIPVNPKKLIIITKNSERVEGYESHFSTCPHAKKWRK